MICYEFLRVYEEKKWTTVFVYFSVLMIICGITGEYRILEISMI